MAAKQCILLTRQIKVPVLLVQSGNDRIVSNAAQQRFIDKLSKTNPNSSLVSIAGAEHEIFVDEALRVKSLVSLNRMLDFAEQLNT